MKKLLLTLLGAFVMGMSMAQQGNHWSPISGTQYNMTVKGVILIDGVQQANNMLEIGAFCGDECRGSRKATLFPPTGDYIVTLAVVSNVVSGETITFRIYDHNAQQELELESLSTLTFVDNTNAGDPTSWFQIAFVTPAFHFTTAGNWSEASNWQGGALPGASDVVFVNADCTLDQDAEVADLTVSDGFSLIVQTGRTLTVTGDLVSTAATGLVIKDGAQVVNASPYVKATVEKDIVAYGANNPDGWYTMASPINTMAIAGSDFLTPNYDLYRFNETRIGGEWENYKDNTNTDFTAFENGRGYLYANNNTFSPAFAGTLNNAAVTYGVTFTDRPDGLCGFNLIGNPFPHAIYKGAGGAIDNASLASGYYTLTNEGAWHVHNYADAIMPGQGILVETVEAASLDIAKSNAAATSESVAAKGEVGFLRIGVAGNGHEDRAFVYFCPGIGLEKIYNLDEQIPSLWVSDNGNDYAIAHADNGYEWLDVSFSNKQESDFRLTVEAKNSEFGYLQLVDNVTGATVNLLEQPDYAFHATGNEEEARFRLVFMMTTGVEEDSVEAPFAFVGDGNIIVAGEGTVLVVDMMGRVLVCRDASNASAISTTEIIPGVYVLRLINGDNVRTQKIVIR